MKLILKRIPRTVAAQGLEDEHPTFVAAEDERTGPFALHTEDGQVLPCQVRTSMDSVGRHEPVRLTVIFTVDGKNLLVEGDV
jgi:hypothetical protein